MQSLTTKQELFSNLLMDPDHTQTSAYRLAYNVDPNTPDASVYAMSSKVASHIKVRLRLRELREDAYQKSPYTVERLRSKLELRSDDAAEARQYGPSIKALELVGKLDSGSKGRQPIRWGDSGTHRAINRRITSDTGGWTTD